MIEVTGLTKVYGDNCAVDHVSFRIANGHIYGLLGRNGAGKTTTMNMMTGCLTPTAGTVRINGYDMWEQPKKAKKCIGYLPENPPLYEDMTPEEYLSFVAEAKGVRGTEIARQVRTAMEETGLLQFRDRLIRKLSKGYRQRVGIAMTMLGNPDIIILDEPTVGLDPKQIVEIRELIRRLGKTKTVVLSSHILSEISELCDEVLILSRGKLVAYNTIEELEKQSASSGNTLLVTVKGDERGVLTVIRSVAGVLTCRTVSKDGGNLTVEARARTGADPRDDIFFALADKRYVVLSTKTQSADLEEVFLSLTGDSLPDNRTGFPDEDADFGEASFRKDVSDGDDTPEEKGGDHE